MVHKKCYGKRKCLTKTVDFVCKKCSSSTGNVEDNEDVTLDGDVVEKLTKCSHLEDVHSSEGKVQEVVTARKDLNGKSLARALCKSCVAEAARKLA